MEKIFPLFLLIILFSFCSVMKPVSKQEQPEYAEEVEVQYISLAGEISEQKAEISGLAWYDDYLILLPQYPHLFPSEYGGSIFAIPKSRIEKYLKGENNIPISPIPISINTQNLENIIDGYEGFESIAFYGNNVFLTMESKPHGMMGYLLRGKISDDMKTITIEIDARIQLQPRAPISNATDETIIVIDDRIITIYELNSSYLKNNPFAYVFDHSLNLIDSLAFPEIEYRITDATKLYKDNNFWAINYMWSGDFQTDNPPLDPIAQKYGEGKTHYQFKTVERLLAFHYSPQGISLLDKPPIQLKLIDDDNSRNWEGIVRYDDKGFIIVTDEFPRTILGFVPVKFNG